ncbi:MAG: hypothetical protein H6625_04565 [Bdellovibrionaceae bacterium]|nr:hypothetical protein [Pseudobdellovibrionaceae bacterium]
MKLLTFLRRKEKIVVIYISIKNEKEDYWSRLNAEEKEWLKNFNLACRGYSKKQTLLNFSEKLKKEIDRSKYLERQKKQYFKQFEDNKNLTAKPTEKEFDPQILN